MRARLFSQVGQGIPLPSSRGRTRTCDPVVNSHLLYQLSYAGISLSPRGEEGRKLFTR